MKIGIRLTVLVVIIVHNGTVHQHNKFKWLSDLFEFVSVSHNWLWAGLHSQEFTLSVNPTNCSPNFKWFPVLFLQIQCLCRFIGKLYTLLLTFLINLFEISIVLHEIFWIKLRLDWMIWNPALMLLLILGTGLGFHLHLLHFLLHVLMFTCTCLMLLCLKCCPWYIYSSIFYISR